MGEVGRAGGREGRMEEVRGGGASLYPNLLQLPVLHLYGISCSAGILEVVTPNVEPK